MSGFKGQLGFKSEATWGTAVTVDTFHEGYLSDNPVREQPPLISAGLAAGRRTPRLVQAGARTVQGPFALELLPSPLATMLSHMFGTIATTGSGPYTHTASPGSTDSKSFTAQVGIPGSGGTVHPFTYSGCRLTGWTIAATAGQIATLNLDVVAKDYVTATALASASYGSEVPFTFIDGSVSVGGSTLSEVNSFELAATIPRRIKHGIGATTIMEPLENGRREHIITVESEFEDLTLHDLANTEVAVVLTFSNGSDSLTITTDAWVQPSTPTSPGADSEVTETFTAICYDETSDANAIEAALVNGEASAA